MTSKFISFPEIAKKWNINTRNDRRKFLKLIASGEFKIHAKHPESGEILPYKITAVDFDTGKIEGYFLYNGPH
jgi:hypothetical protein